jgi:predicted small lipoprotein YifL
MRTQKFLIPAGLAIAAVLALSACGQAGPLYLPDSESSHKNKAIRRDKRAAAQGPAPDASPAENDNGSAAPGTNGPASPKVDAPTAPASAANPAENSDADLAPNPSSNSTPASP